ncbi:NAD-dependent epimerase/dehydratase family protein [Natrarchaeobaculum sulfurireducens]|uniref:Nucleoside-diphosphate-sugar epimerase n=1 Tax=Natrarchaeobaculum sulfurireducens TaxID=2044521 RepID=A0A346PDY2_9EURY|nr:NAD-dependent epimerase/dehydratase family protein [Natrarchaeobaculum sulfurireducens]AXR77727.1 Nucleoside-diphosphate-sugar epimerase [Natrarchaeobaculum sulfurireducens]
MRAHPKQVLITGSSGTIGTALMKRLLTEGDEVYGVDTVANQWEADLNKRTAIIDLCDPSDFDVLPTELDMIVHLGAHARVHQLVQEPKYAMENLEMTFNLLEFAREFEIPEFIFASSREVYGNNDKVVYSESDTNTDRSESPYTASKIGGEALVQSYDNCYEMSTCTVRFSNVYGRYDRSDRVIPQFIARSYRGEPLTVYGSEKVLDFTYLDDCVDGISKVIKHFPKVTGKTLNICSGQGASLVELAHEINEQTPRNSEINTEPSRPGEVKRYIGDITTAQKLLDYQPQYSLTEGLSETIDWYLDRPSLIEELTSQSVA